MFAKFVSVGFLPPNEMSLALQEPTLIPWEKRKNQNERDCGQLRLFFPYFSSP